MKEKMILIAFALILAFSLQRFGLHLDRTMQVKAALEESQGYIDDAKQFLYNSGNIEAMTYIKYGDDTK